jgi:hypothetical protein
MSNLAIRNRLTVGNIWQGGAIALFDANYAGVLLDLGNVTDSTFDQELEAVDFRTARATGTLITEARPIKRLELPITIKVNSPDPGALDLALFGTGQVAYNQPSATASTQNITVAAMDMWHKVAGFELANVVVKKGGTVATLGTDYDEDDELGAIKPLTGGMFSISDVMALTFDLPAINTVESQIETRVGFTYGEFYLYMVLPPNEGRATEQVWLRHMAKSRLEPSSKNPSFTPDKPMEWDYKITPIPSGDPTYPFGYLRQIK